MRSALVVLMAGLIVTSAAAETTSFAPGRIVVQLTPDAAALVSDAGAARSLRSGLTGLDAVHQRVRATAMRAPFLNVRDRALAHEVGLDRIRVIEFDAAIGLEVARSLYAADPSVESVALDPIETPDVVPNDPVFSSNWGHRNTGQLPQYVHATGLHNGPLVGTVGFDAGMTDAWAGSQGYGDSDILIAMIDANGVDVQHADLRLVPGWDFWDNDPNPDDPCLSPGIGCGHGTSCAGVAAAIANNGHQDAGAAGGCTVIPFRVNGASQVASALVAAADSGAHVACLSFTYYGVSSHPALQAAATYANASGVMLLGSSGNRNDNSGIWLPKNLPEVLCIGSASPCGQRKRSSSVPSELRPDVSPDPAGVTCDNEVFWGSGWGTNTQNAPDALDFLAPVILPAAAVGGGVDPYFSGTSCSNAYAVGVAALIKSRHPSWTNAQVLQHMRDTAIDIVGGEAAVGWDRYTGYGMLDAGAALAESEPDLQPQVASGWFDSIVPRSSAGADTTNLPAPSSLPGDATTYVNVAHANAGAGATVAPYGVAVRVDGQETFTTTVASTPPGGVQFDVDIPHSISGGRHTLEARIDGTDTNAESDETNNEAARQWIFEPVTLPGDTTVVRSSPPNPTAGTENVAGTPSRNQDGVRFSSAPVGTVHGVAVHADNASENYDLRFYSPSTGPLDGFEDGTEVAASLRSAGELDWLVANEQQLGSFTLDAGIEDAGLTGVSASHVEMRKSASTTFPSGPVQISLGAHEMLVVGRAPVPGNSEGVAFELVTDDPGTPLHVAVISPSVGIASLLDALGTATTDDPAFGPAKAVLELSLASGQHPWVVWRDPSDGTEPITGSLTIRPTPANVVAHTALGAFGPIVPSATNTACNAWPAPAVLPGNAMTHFDYQWRNDGPPTSVPLVTHVELDGVSISFADGAMDPDSVFCRVDSLVVRGGRHTIGLRVDVSDANEELYRDDNNWASQWVWTPLSLANEAPVTRPMPPAVQGGWSLIATGTPHSNADGLRTPNLAPAGSDGRLAVAAVVPGAGSDVDLVLHPPSTGAQDGFRDDAVLAASESDGEVVDFVVVEVDVTQGGATGERDLGIRNVSGNASYTAEVAAARHVSLPFGATSPQDAFAAGDAVTLYEITADSPGGNAIVQLRMLGGNADLALAIVQRDGSGYYSRADAVVADDGGPGMNEQVAVTLAANERFGVVVFKRDASALPESATFEILLGQAASTDAPPAAIIPTRTSIRLVAPNPFAPRTTVRFDVARAGQVEISVHDTAGRLVRTLVNDPMPAGRHAVDWDGRDRNARSVASGIYFVTLRTPDVVEMRKVTRLR